MYYNRFFKTREEAREFQKENGGVLYSNTPKSRTKKNFRAEMAVAFDARREVVDGNATPYCVAWNSTEG